MAQPTSPPSDVKPVTPLPNGEKPLPSLSSIPQASAKRLAQAAEDAVQRSEEEPETVLYLAYGSNMCAKTLLGMRGIRPLSRVNVWAPSLELVFDEPGLPYREPCFASVGFRKTVEDPIYPLDDPDSDSVYEWNDGLVGVVYELTQEDWHTILRTEGAGFRYAEIVVPCFALPSKLDGRGGTLSAKHSKPFLAKTLNGAKTRCEGDMSRCGWWCRLISKHPRLGKTSPSARYLHLLTDGARENDLPKAYQRYLASVRPFVASGRWLKIGVFIFTSIWVPPLMSCMMASRYLSNKAGIAPRWLNTWMTVLLNMMWMQYDAVFQPLFGDGRV